MIDGVQRKGLKTLEDLRALVLIEENCWPKRVVTYLNEQKDVTLSGAAVLADEYVLTHKSVFGEKSVVQTRFSDSSFQDGSSASVMPFKASVSSSAEGKPTREDWGTRESPVCFFCKKRGNIVANCYALQKEKKPVKSVALVKTSSPVLGLASVSSKSELEVYAPFLMEVSLCRVLECSTWVRLCILFTSSQTWLWVR